MEDATNFVGLLQEKCVKMKTLSPRYYENDSDSKTFKLTCSVGELITEGIGINKKAAKQNAAKLMISKLESEDVPLVKNNVPSANSNAVSKLFEYSLKEKKAKPLFSEKPEEDGLIVIECSFEGYIGVGKGLVKKDAKEKSADQVLKHFDIYNYFKNIKVGELRLNSLKSPVTQLNELCQVKKLKNAIYREEIISLADNKTLYEFSCTVGDNQVKSSQKISKKDAKNEAASLMLNILDSYTPITSPIDRPIPPEEDEEESPTKKPLDSYTPITSPIDRPIPPEEEEDEEESPTKKPKIM